MLVAEAIHPFLALGPVLAGIACCLLIVAALHDIAARIIPDMICASLAVIGVLLRISEGGLLYSLLATTIVLVLLTLFGMRGWIGGGDVKLLSAGVLLVPPLLIPSTIFCVGIAGGLLALIYILLRRIIPQPGPRPRHRLSRIWRVERFRIRRGGPLPYGVGIAAGCAFVLFKSMP